MKILLRILSCFIVVFAVAARGQQQSLGLDWNHYQAVSPLLRGAVEQLGKEGLTAVFQKAEVEEFSGLFAVAIVPTEYGRIPPSIDSGTVCLMVVFGSVPPPEKLSVAQVLRVDYKNNAATKDTEIEGKQATLTGNKTFVFDERVFYLIVDNQEGIREKINRVLFLRAGQYLKIDCFGYRLKTVHSRCEEFHEKSYPDWVRCIVAGWLSAKRSCYKFTGVP